MTSNEAELIERLIAEAAKRGTVEELMRQAVKAGEDAAMQAKDRNAAAQRAEKLYGENSSLRAELRRASVSIDASLAALRSLFLATRQRHKNRKAFHNAMLNAADYLESQRPF